MKILRLSHINKLLSILVIALPVYMLVMPYVPQIRYLAKKNTVDAAPFGRLSTAVSKPADDTSAKPIPQDNRLVIPSALVNQPIKDGADLSAINNGGIWKKPVRAQSPKEPGNTLLLGHRFTFNQPEGALYHLDKTKVGDVLAIYWEGEELLYTIVEKKVVSTEAVEIENDTPERILTIYTCTPLLTAKDRLVIVARPLERLP